MRDESLKLACQQSVFREASLSMSDTFRLSEEERKSFDENGFLIRHNVFTRDECRQMGEAVEQLERDMLAAKRTTKHTVGSYMFELQREMQSVVKWEPDFPDV